MKRSVRDVLYVVMPAYNEEDNIESVVVSWLKVLKCGSCDSRLVVADNGSTDKTHDILLKLKKKYKQLEILQTLNQYHGPKVIALYKYAIKKEADYIFQTDSDGQTNPDEFKKFWAVRDRCDGVIGIRRTRGDGKSRAFVEKVVCFMLKLFFGVKVEDANAPFRLMRRRLLEKYLDKLPDNYEIPNIILTAYFVRNKEKIVFTEITFRPRTGGKNSINVKKIVGIGMKAVKDFCHFRRNMKKEDAKSVEEMPWIKRLMVIGVFGLVVGLLVVISPAFHWNGGMEMTDSSVFLTVGRQMKEGMMPYVDTFDHKGPLLYIINFFGVLINRAKGIFVFEFLAMFGALWFMFKIFRLYNRKVWFSMIMTILLFTPFVGLYLSEGGNLVEQYALPFIAFSLYAFLKYYWQDNLSSMMTFGVGLSLAAVLMMRANMAGLWMVFCIAIVFKCLINKQYSELRRYIIWFLIGMACIIVPIIIWLIANSAFGVFVEDYLVFNLAYSGEKQEGSKVALLFFLEDIIIVMSLVLVMDLIMRKRKSEYGVLMWIYLLAYVLCIVMVCISGRVFPHYGMVLAPMTVFPFSIICKDLTNDGHNDSLSSMVMLVIVVVTWPTWLEVANRVASAMEKRVRNEELINSSIVVCGYVDEYTDASDKITVYGNWNYIYLRCNRLPASKYSYQFPIGEIKEEYMTEYFAEIKNNKTKVFIVQEQHMDDKAFQFLESSGYTEKWRNGDAGARVYLLDDEGAKNEDNRREG